MKHYLTKNMNGLIPSDPGTIEWFNKLKPGQVVSVEIKKVRNYQFLKKWFSLLHCGFEQWEPGKINSEYGKPEKNFDRYRSDIIILCGFFDSVVRLDGSVRIEPKSISFAKMTEEEFSDLYSKTIDVLLKFVYNSDMTSEKLNNLTNHYLTFA